MKEITIIFLLTVLAPAHAPRVAALECDRLLGVTSDEIVSYLNGIVPDQGNAECITFAIKRLGRERYEPAITVLARLLDFPRPRSAREKQGLYLHIQGIDEIYPAASALEEIGKTSLPAVLGIIKEKSSSATARTNATAVWMEIYKYESPKGVALLKQEVDQADNASSKQNLMSAVSAALGWCNPSDEIQCKRAAETGHLE